jgi:2-oxoglutarate ferredoxin oxidoreductase subunit gamma
MNIKIFFAGFGGQGVLAMGHILAHAGMVEDRYVTYLPAYGAEVRGGTANCTVALGDEEIASPVASEPEILVAMNGPSLTRFVGRVSAGGFLFYNSTLSEWKPTRLDLEVVPVPATELATEVGMPKASNLVMLGAVCGRYSLVKPESMRKAIGIMFASKPKVIDSNVRAFDKGLEFSKTFEVPR